jgi:mono/diheme cytochrome c family protein
VTGTVEENLSMKKLLKRLALVVAAVVLLAVLAGVFFVLTFKPAQRPAATASVETAPERLARGRYLATAALGCISCHSQRDWNRYGGPVIGPVGAGGDCFTEEQGYGGTVCPANITPDADTGIGAWSDGEILRAFREGVDRDGKGLIPACPYEDFRHLSDEDAGAVVVYLRTLEPVSNRVPEPHFGFPTSFFLKLAPQPLEGPVAKPERSDPVAYGEYLVTVAHCRFCHTQVDERYQPLPGMMLAGGMEHRGPFGTVVSTNLTPHDTGIGAWSKENFLGIFRAFADELPPSEPGKNTPMPWPDLAHMTEADLGAIYDYLQTVPPVDHAVASRRPPAAASSSP